MVREGFLEEARLHIGSEGWAGLFEGGACGVRRTAWAEMGVGWGEEGVGVTSVCPSPDLSFLNPV